MGLEWEEPPRRRSPADSGNNSKDGDCCPMVAAVKSVKRGKLRLARRYAAMSVRLISQKAGNRMKNKIALPLAVAAIAAGTFLGATPALAAHVGPSGYASFWDGCGSPAVGYCGAAWPIPVQAANVCHAVPSGSNDKMTAVDNNTSHNIVLYQNGGCNPSGGTSWTIYAGTMTGIMGSGANNAVSSYSWR